MADIYSVAQTVSNAGATVATAGDNSRKLLGDGAAGIGPYTRFGTPALTAVKIVSTAVDFTTTPAAANSAMAKAVNALQGFAEVYYVGKPTSSGANQFIAIVNSNTLTRGGRGADAFGGTADTGEATFENIETVMSLALGQAVTDVTVTEVSLTGLTFA
jgi:hypothetical protein